MAPPEAGTLLAASPTSTRFRLDVDDNGSWDVEALVDTAAIGSGQSIYAEWPNAWTSTVGKHTIEACLDATNVIAEFSSISGSQSESNNCQKRTFTIFP